MTEEVVHLAEERDEEQEIGLGQGEDEEDEEYKDLKPWEQHSSVINIPRYNYKAPSSLLERSHSGFLITCPIKREKSATKEAILILEEHIGFACTNGFERSEPFSRSVAAKRTCLLDAVNIDSLEMNVDGNKSADSTGEAVKVANLLLVADGNVKRSSNLSLVKLTRNGLVLFILPNGNYYRVIDTLASIFCSLASGNQKPPIWCHRIIPIQETCCPTETGLQKVVTKLVRWYLSRQQDKTESSIKFAVSYNRRGIEGTTMKNQKCNSAITMLERNKCFEVVARAFKTVVENSVVDLISPEVAVLVELLPLSGLPLESLMVGVSVLPCELVMTKPRLSVKPLVINAEGTKRKG